MCVVPIEEGILAKLVLDTSHHGAVFFLLLVVLGGKGLKEWLDF